MKVAVIGPVDIDTVIIDGVSKTYMGGIPYYEANVFKSLEISVDAFITYAKEDEIFVRENFQGINIHPIYTNKTLEGQIIYSKQNPDEREIFRTQYDPNTIIANDELIDNLRKFDYIILGPLFYENIPYEIFEKLKDINLVLGNFGIFNYREGEKELWRNPENLEKVAPFLKLLFLDEKEIKFAARKKTTEESAEYFMNFGIETIVVTKGSKGSIVFTKSKKYIIPAFPAKKLADTTGAGDTFVAAFIASMELFDDTQKKGRICRDGMHYGNREAWCISGKPARSNEKVEGNCEVKVNLIF